MRRAMMLVTALPNSRRTRCRLASMPAAGAGTGDQVTLVDEQHVAVDDRGGVAAGEFVGVHPVRRTSPPVEQARGTGDEHPRTHREHRRARLVGGAQRVERLPRVGLRRPGDGRHRHHVGADQAVEPVIGHQLGPDAGAQGPARFGTAHLEVDGRDAVSGPVDAEHLADDPELEHRDTVENESRDAVQSHGRILSHWVSTATVG